MKETKVGGKHEKEWALIIVKTGLWIHEGSWNNFFLKKIKKNEEEN